MKKWTDLREWFAEERALIKANYDSITLYTGEEGRGKSYTMLALERAKDASFTIERVHFDQEAFMADAVTLQPGSSIHLDEFEGHRRMSMHGARLEFLRFLKERRSLRLRAGVAFPHISQMDRDILNSRVRYWADTPMRGVLVVKSRVAETVVDKWGNPFVKVRWPVRGRFHINEPKGKLIQDYDRLKAQFTRREDTGAPEPVVRRFNEDAAREVLGDIKRLLGR